MVEELDAGANWYLDKAGKCIHGRDYSKAKNHLSHAQLFYPCKRVTAALEDVEAEIAKIDAPNSTTSNVDVNEGTSHTNTVNHSNIMPEDENSLQMRTKILSCKVEDFLNKNQIKDQLITSEELGENMYIIQKYLSKARDINVSDVKTCLYNLEQAETMFAIICNKYSSHDETTATSHNSTHNPVTTKRNSAHHGDVTVKGNKEDVVKLTNIAETAFENNNLDKAKRLLERAQRIHPTIKAKVLLDRVCTAITKRDKAEEVEQANEAVELKSEEQKYHQTEPTENTNIVINSDEHKCLQIAKKALDAGDLDKTERFLCKVKNMNANIDLEICYSELRQARASRSSSEHMSQLDKPDTRKPKTCDEHNTSESNNCIYKATDAIACKDNAYPANMLMKAEKNKKHDLEDTPKTDNCVKECDVKRNEAEECIRISEEAFAAGNLIKAEKMLQKAERIFSTAKAQEGLVIVHNAMESRKEQHKDYLSTAQNAMDSNDLAKAQRILLKAQDLTPDCDFITQKLGEVTYLMECGPHSSKTKKHPEKMTKKQAEPSHQKHKYICKRTSQPKRENKMPSDSKMSINTKITTHKKYMEKAKEFSKTRDFDNAISLLIIAEKVYPSREARQLFIEYTKAKLSQRISKEKKQDDDYDTFKAKKYADIAEKAYIAGEYKDAKDYFGKAQFLYDTDFVTEMNKRLRHVMEDDAKVNEGLLASIGSKIMGFVSPSSLKN